jgi:hypothetical protein
MTGRESLPGQLEALLPAEAARLTELEQVIDRGARAYLEVGNALLAIRNERLYRATHTSFAGYLRERWDLGRSHGYRLIDAAKTAAVLVESVPNVGASGNGDDWRARLREQHAPPPVATPDAGDPDEERAEQVLDGERAAECPPWGTLPPPRNERVSRRLTVTARTDPVRAQEIWRLALERHGEGATAEQVAAIAKPATGEVAAGEVVSAPDATEARKAYSSAASRAFRHNDATSAKHALSLLRTDIKPALEWVAQHGIEREPRQ